MRHSCRSDAGREVGHGSEAAIEDLPGILRRADKIADGADRAVFISLPGTSDTTRPPISTWGRDARRQRRGPSDAALEHWPGGCCPQCARHPGRP